MNFLWYLVCSSKVYIHVLIYFRKVFLDIFNYLLWHYFGFLLQGFKLCMCWCFFTCFLYNALSFKIFISLFLFLYSVILTVFSFCVYSPCVPSVSYSSLLGLLFSVLLSAHILSPIIVSSSLSRILVFPLCGCLPETQLLH